MNELLDNNPTQQERIKGELDLTFIQVAKINDQLNDIEARLSNYLPPAEMAMLGRMALGLEQRREEIISLFSSLSIRSSQLEGISIPVESQAGIAVDDHNFNDTVAEIVANLPPINLTETEPETIIEAVADESPTTEIHPIIELVQPIEVKTPKSKTSKSGKVNKKNSTKPNKQPKPVDKKQPTITQPITTSKLQPKFTAPRPNQHSPQNNRPTDRQNMMETRRRYLESLDKATTEPIILTNRQKLNPNLDMRYLKFLMGQGKKPAQPLSEKRKIVTFNIFFSTPENQRRPGWQQRILEAQIA
jgi:hypothetical protein